VSAHTRNLYADLRSKPSDDLATIKSNFRAIVRETHSDANGGSDEHRQTFERAVQAWSCSVSLCAERRGSNTAPSGWLSKVPSSVQAVGQAFGLWLFGMCAVRTAKRC